MPETEKKIELKSAFHREATITRVQGEEDGGRTLELSFSSELPVQRFLDGDFGDEILDHSESSVRLGRLQNGGPVLIDHRNAIDSLVGVVESVSINEGGDRLGRAVVRFSDDAESQIVFQKAKSGVLRNVSVGYMIHTFTKTRDDNDKVTFRVTDWEPMEISMVAVPADPSVGPGRTCAPYEARVLEMVAPEQEQSEDSRDENPVVPDDESMNQGTDESRSDDPVVRDGDAEDDVSDNSLNTQNRGITMPDEIKDPADITKDVLSQERDRVREINAVIEMHPQVREQAQVAINDGTSVDAFRAAIMPLLGKSEAIPADTSLGLSDKEVRGFSLLKLYRAHAFMHQNSRVAEEAAFELEVCSEAARMQQKLGVEKIQGFVVPHEVLTPRMAPRTDGAMTGALVAKFPELRGALNVQQRLLTALTATDGAELVATDLLSASFIDVLRNVSSVMQAGATLLTDLNGNVAIPRKTSGSTATWLATEGVTPAGTSEPQFDQVSLTPRQMAVHGGYSRQLLLQSSLAIENLLRLDHVAGMAIEMDRVSLYGSGAAGQPLGVSGQTGVNTVTMTPGAITWVQTVDFETQTALDNALFPNATSYMLKPSTRGQMKTTTKVVGDGGAGFIWDNGNAPVNGYPAWVTNQVETDNAFFGYWSDLLIGMWGGLDVIVDPYTDAKIGNVNVTHHQSIDVAVRHPDSFTFGS